MKRITLALAALFGCAAAAFAADSATAPCKRTENVPGQGNVTFVETTATADNTDVSAAIAWDSNGDGNLDRKGTNRNRRGKTVKVRVRLSEIPAGALVGVFVNGVQQGSSTNVNNLPNC